MIKGLHTHAGFSISQPESFSSLKLILLSLKEITLNFLQGSTLLVILIGL